MRRQWLVDLRHKRGLTQAQVAAAVGISRNHYTGIEIGDRTGSGKVLLRLARFYDVPMSWFYQDLDQAGQKAEGL